MTLHPSFVLTQIRYMFQVLIYVNKVAFSEYVCVTQFPSVSNSTFKLYDLAEEILSVSNISLLLYLHALSIRNSRKSEK